MEKYFTCNSMEKNTGCWQEGMIKGSGTDGYVLFGGYCTIILFY